MKKIMMAAVAATFAVGMATTASALTIVGGSAGVIPGAAQDTTPENNVLQALGMGSSIGGFFGATIDGGSASKLRLELIGYEASNKNTFAFQGNDIFTGGQNGGARFNPATDVGKTLAATTVSSLGGILDFAFRSVSRTGATGTAANGANPDANPATSSAPFAMNFFATFGDNMARTGKVLWLFLDDIGQAGGDDHDDLVVRISVVPLPASALLLISGLGLMALRRKRPA